MKIIKKAVRKILRAVHPDLEYQWVEQYHFNQLKRQPPELMWQALRPAPFARLDAGLAQVRNEMYVFGGFLWGGKVRSALDVYDLDKERWTASFDFPPDLAQTHLGIAHDKERFIYLVSGQWGTNCRPSTPKCFVFDTRDKSFRPFPTLPQARYAAVVQLLAGRLHVLAGAKDDRTTSATDHWSIAVADGKALESNWQVETSVPKGGPHRGSISTGDYLYMFGGQEGDYVAIPGDPDFRCTPTLSEETRIPDVYRYHHQLKTWERMADMPVAVSHTETATIKIRDSVVILGGDDARIGKTDVVTAVDLIQVYNLKSDTWKTIGLLPSGLKSFLAVYYKGNLYVTAGQRNRAPGDPITMNQYERGVWRAKLDIGLL